MNSVRKYPWFVKGDLDGFFGLAVDNLVQVLVIVTLCTQLCGFSKELIYTRMLPGVAVSLFVGNLYYALHARRVAKRDGNTSCTALPYGISTPTVFAYILFIMSPVYERYRVTLGDQAAGELAWKVGLIACIGGGVIEFLAAFIGGWIRKVTPRAALLGALAAIGVIFVASPFAFQIFERPLIAIVPMFIVLIGYFAKVRFPLGLPSGLVAVLVGTILAWTVPFIPGAGPEVMSAQTVKGSLEWVRLCVPHGCWNEVLALLRQDSTLLWSFLGVVVPMGLINAMGSLQNIESAEAAGDRFSTGVCMAMNGVGTIAAGLFGSCFPMTIYIGHPGWKALGARSGYSIINGLFFSVAFVLGLGAVVVSVIPMEAGMAIVMWIGIIITAQSYEAVPRRHFPAVAIAFFPAVATIAVLFMPQVLSGVDAQHGVLSLITTHHHMLETARSDSWWPIGIYALAGANSGFMITGIIISAISAFLIDRRFKTAGIWSVVAVIVTLLGFHHAYRIEPDQPGQLTSGARELMVWQRAEPAFKDTGLYLNVPEGTFFHRGYRIAAAYAVAAAMMFVIHSLRRKGSGFEDIVGDTGEKPAEERPAFPGMTAARNGVP
ncbi:MAG TPA: NCS2 family permease [Phycisphaerae bacterium]|nr:NCS2 family permease [Phycisphaerae bacterium]